MRADNLLFGTLAALAFAFSSPAQGAITAGVDFPDHIVLGNGELALNGTAVRGFFGVQVYAAGLYLGRVSSDAEGIMLLDHEAKRLRIVMLRVVPEDKFAAAVQENIDRNFSAAEKQRFAGELDTFFKCFAGGADLVNGSEVHIDYLPGEGTVVTVAGRTLATIPGREFYHALLRLWIGKPLQSSIKAGLLGIK